MKALEIIVAVVLALHGLIHFMGTAAYLKLADIQGLPYKTTVLAGRWDLGEAGTTFIRHASFAGAHGLGLGHC